MSNTAVNTADNSSKSGQDVAPARLAFSSILICSALSALLAAAGSGGVLAWAVHAGRLGSAAAVQPKPKAEVVPSHVVVLEPMVVNLADGQSYLRAGVSLRVADPAPSKDKPKSEGAATEKGASTGAPELRDTTLMVLSSQTADRLLAPKGRDELKQALRDAFAHAPTQERVLDVYLTDFLVQRG